MIARVGEFQTDIPFEYGPLSGTLGQCVASPAVRPPLPTPTRPGFCEGIPFIGAPPITCDE